MRTVFTTFWPDGTRTEAEFDLAPDPSLAELKGALRATLGSADVEHVSVLWRDRRADMFVDEDGHGKGLARNEAATGIYRAAWLRDHPATPLEELPAIAGPAVIADRLVWS